MQGGDFRGERRLIADPRWQASEKTRDFAAGLDETKHVVRENAIGIPIAGGVLYPAFGLLNPIVAALAMSRTTTSIP
jgi:hypothetical protein